MCKEELIGIEEAKQANSDRMSLVKQLIAKNQELQDIVDKQQEEIQKLKALVNWNEFLYHVENRKYEIKNIPESQMVLKDKKENLHIRSYNICKWTFKHLPDKQWFLNTNLSEEIKGIGPLMDIYIKTHIDSFYEELKKEYSNV